MKQHTRLKKTLPEQNQRYWLRVAISSRCVCPQPETRCVLVRAGAGGEQTQSYKVGVRGRGFLAFALAAALKRSVSSLFTQCVLSKPKSRCRVPLPITLTSALQAQLNS